MRGIDPQTPLTRRQWDYACLMAQGLMHKEIVALLHVAPRTGKFYAYTIYRKCGFSKDGPKRVAFALWWAEQEWTTYGDYMKAFVRRATVLEMPQRAGGLKA
jgi:DNA-binding NarL/FixJ family response regulator